MPTQPAAARQNAKPNRLSGETSPYLLQHAYNPVDWYPWGVEALKRSRDEDRPIFLSIGYSACHWCHVMEHESFENPEIAALMNGHFINIKVDREERPDLDQIYMNSVQLLTGRGGWPMSVFLTPDLKPFYGGTYWPPTSRMGMPGFQDILQGVHEAWSHRRKDVLKAAQDVTSAVVNMSAPSAERSTLNEALVHSAMNELLQQVDRANGGFGTAPKFPHPMDLRVLLRAWKRFGTDEALDAARLTLDKMAQGGIYDHLGGGFHRYATDARWLVPHFEKMLYDNALLAPAYLEAYQATGNVDYARVARETLDYVLREMTQPEGGFYSTQDADSEGVEGKFFVWTESEIVQHLGEDDARLFSYCYDVTPQGNWEGHNILNRVKTHAQAARMLGLSEADLAGILDRSKQTLLDVRSKRIPPGRDDKVLVAWNGMMIAAMAQAAQVLGEARYAHAAARAADFMLTSMRTESGRLLHAYKDGRARFDAYLDDYACLIDGLTDVYQATFQNRYLEAALALAELMLEDFADHQHGGFFYTAANHEQLITRTKDWQDSATPSGNSMAVSSLLRLGRLTCRADLEQHGVATLNLLSGLLSRHSTAAGQALIALDFWCGPTHEIAVIDGESPDDSADVLRALHRRFLPNKVVARRGPDTADADVATPLLRGKSARDGAATVYLCDHGTCHAPVFGVNGLEASLGET